MWRRSSFSGEARLGVTAGPALLRRGFLEEVILNEERRHINF